MTLAELFIKLGLKKDGFDQGIDQAKEKTNAFGNVLKKVAGWVAGAFAVDAIVSFGKSCVMAFDEAEKASTRLLTALKGNKDVQQSLMTQARELQGTTLFSHDDTENAMSLVAAFVKEEGQIKRLIPAIQDFAAAKGIDLASAANLVGRAFMQSGDGLGRFRIGIEGASGSAERLDSIIARMNEHWGDQAAALAKVGIGPLTIIAHQWNDVKEEIGGAMVKTGLFSTVIRDLSNTMYALSTENLKWWQKLDAVIGLAMGDSAVTEELESMKRREKAIKDYDELVKGAYETTKKSVEADEKKYTASEQLTNQIKWLNEEIKTANKLLALTPEGEEWQAQKDKVDQLTESLKKLEEQQRALLPRQKAPAEMTPSTGGLKFGSPTMGAHSQPIVGGVFANEPIGPRFGEAEKFFNNMQDAVDMTKIKIKPPPLSGLDRWHKALGEKIKDATNEFNKPIEDWLNNFNDLIKQGMAQAVTSFAEGIGSLITGDMNIGEFGKTILASIGSFLKAIGSALIAYGIAMNAFTKAFHNPFVAIAAGVALVAIGSMISNMAKAGPSAPGGGGSSSGGSSAGDNGRAQMALTGNVTFELHGDKLIGVLNNTNRRNSIMR